MGGGMVGGMGGGHLVGSGKGNGGGLGKGSFGKSEPLMRSMMSQHPYPSHHPSHPPPVVVVRGVPYVLQRPQPPPPPPIGPTMGYGAYHYPVGGGGGRQGPGPSEGSLGGHGGAVGRAVGEEGGGFGLGTSAMGQFPNGSFGEPGAPGNSGGYLPADHMFTAQPRFKSTPSPLLSVGFS
jgi:hypothetical protein